MAIYRGAGGAGDAVGDASSEVLLALQAKDAAIAAQVAAEAAQAAAQTAETNAETAETNAETAETNAETAETNAETAATNAASSASAASTSATNAAASASTATTQATNASNSASSASTSASNASTSATNAASSASTATTQATNASNSASAAATSATNASNSASAASTSATNAASSATSASGSASTATTQATNASNSASAASTSATNASNSASAASTSATNASNSASAASTSATNASNSASSASTSATNAASAQTAAESARDATLAAYDSFDDRYLGAKSSAPTLDNDGNALLAGSLYFDTVSQGMKLYTGSAWVDAYVPGSTYLAKANNLSDLTNTGTARTNLGLGSIATQAASSVSITGGSVTGITDLAIADGGTGASTAAGARTNLGLDGFVNMKNRIINGAMVIDQRNAGASITPISGQFAVDRWRFDVTQASKFTAQQNAGSVTPPAGFSNYLGITSSSAYSVAAGDAFYLGQSIEGFNTADLDFGKSTAKTVTLSFWVRSSLTGTFGGALQNAAQDYSYPFSYTISSANTWEQKSLTIVGPTAGTWVGATNGQGLRVFFSLGTGTTYSGTAGSWSANLYVSATGATSVVGTNGATLFLTGVQLEVGSTATSFDYRPYGTELALCQRYYQKFSWTDSSLTTAQAASTSSAFGAPVYFVQEMRASPTITLPTAGSSAGNATFLTSTGGYPSTIGTVTTEAIRTTGFSIKCSGYTSGFTAGNATSYYAAGTATITASIEL